MNTIQNVNNKKLGFIGKIIQNYDSSIVSTILLFLPVIILTPTILPNILENYSYNQKLITGMGDVISYNSVFSFTFKMILLTFMSILSYIIVRNYYMRNYNIQLSSKMYVTDSKLLISVVLAAIFCIGGYFVNNFYSDKNMDGLSNQIISIKEAAISGKCVDSDGLPNLNLCMPNIEKMPGSFSFYPADVYTNCGSQGCTSKKEVNRIAYSGFTQSLCKSLFINKTQLSDKVSIEFIGGVNPTNFKSQDCLYNSHIFFKF